MLTQVILPYIAGLPGGMEWLILLAVLVLPVGVLVGVFVLGYTVGKSRAARDFHSQQVGQGHQQPSM